MSTPQFISIDPADPIGEADAAEAMSLESVKARGVVEGLMLSMTISQSYRNRTDRVLETVYTFPLAFGAVLLEVSAVIAGRRLTGVVMKDKRAQQEYEEAISGGDAPILVEMSTDGLYSANLGNLKPGEEAVIELRYAQLLHRHGDRVQVRLPTTIAPRYGNAAAAGVKSHESVEASLAASYPFDLQLDINGILAAGEVSSPSHRVSVMRTDRGVTTRLATRSWLDRDFVLDLLQATTQSSPCETVLSHHDGGTVALASFCAPPFKQRRNSIDLKIVVDCSGSMAGDRMNQAKAALHHVLGDLTPSDQLTLSRFGDEAEHEFKRLNPADEAGIRRAAHVVELTEANLGGTELETALKEVMSIRGARDAADILLITDGDVWEAKEVVQLATKSRHRIFSIGVGSAPAESLLRQLSLCSGGACELVDASEDMEPAVERVMQRIRSPRTQHLSIDWGFKPAWVTQLPLSLFAGDTVHVFAGFKDPVSDIQATLTCQGDDLLDNQSLRLTAGTQREPAPDETVNQSDLPRMAAWQRITDATERIFSRASTRQWANDLALEHQLITRETSLFMVLERDAPDKTNGMPTLQKIHHMLAAGWGGVGSTRQLADASRSGQRTVVRAMRSSAFVVDDLCARDERVQESDSTPLSAYLENADDDAPEIITIDELLIRMETHLDEVEELDDPDDLLGLLGWGTHALPDPVNKLLEDLVSAGLTLRQARALFLHEVVRRFTYEGLPGTRSLAIIEGVVSSIADARQRDVEAMVDKVFEGATLNSW